MIHYLVTMRQIVSRIDNTKPVGKRVFLYTKCFFTSKVVIADVNRRLHQHVIRILKKFLTFLTPFIDFYKEVPHTLLIAFF